MTNTNPCSIHATPMNDAPTFKYVKDLFGKSVDELVHNDHGKWRNNMSEVRESMGKVHNLIRTHVANAHHVTGVNLYPLIVASEAGSIADPANHGRQGCGGYYTLYRNPNEVYKCAPVHPVYELAKVACHLALGIFVIVEPHLALTTDNKGTPRLRFYNKLNEYREALFIASETIKSINNSDEIKKLFDSRTTQQLIRDIVDESIRFCDFILLSKYIQRSEFVKHVKTIRPMMEECMSIATDFQVRNTIEMLMKWKQMLTEDEWENMYAVIPTVWVTAANCPREQILRAVMDKENQNTHIIIGENVFNQLDARRLCGRVVHDRMMARYMFGIEDTWSQRKCQGLGSRQDSLSDYTKRNIADYAKQYRLKSNL